MTAIIADDLGKFYLINQAAKSRLLRDTLGNGLRRLTGQRILQPSDNPDVKEHWALRHVSFEVAQGERVGVIGANGAGKSTLLKILSRVTIPSEGMFRTQGKLASMLEVGTGFHPDLSGRENIFLSGAILGMKRAEIKSKLDDIIVFSGIEKFIDTPVKFYSSGMYVRLAFSVSAWLDPDILIIDEVLSVGDQAFQRRCAERMKDLTQEGRTVLFVSHSMASVQAMCTKALYIEKGRMVTFASVESAAGDYQEEIIEAAEGRQWHRASFSADDPSIEFHKDSSVNEDSPVRCVGGAACAPDGMPSTEHALNAPISLSVEYEITEDMPYDVVPNFHVYDTFGGRVLITMPAQTFSGKAGRYRASCEIPAFQLNKGRYTAALNVSSFNMEPPVHFAAINALRFEIFETNGMDERRHGWLGELPGASRVQLRWSCLPV